MSDPRLNDPRDYRGFDYDRASGVNAVWGWVAAGVFVAAVLLFVFASNNNNTTAQNGISLPPTANAPQLPARSGSSTTGMGETTSAPTNTPGGVAK
jgi:hypothetical protein